MPPKNKYPWLSDMVGQYKKELLAASTKWRQTHTATDAPGLEGQPEIQPAQGATSEKTSQPLHAVLEMVQGKRTSAKLTSDSYEGVMANLEAMLGMLAGGGTATPIDLSPQDICRMARFWFSRERE